MINALPGALSSKEKSVAHYSCLYSAGISYKYNRQFFFLIFTLTYFVNNYSLLFVEFAPGLQKEKKKELTDKVKSDSSLMTTLSDFFLTKELS